MGLIPTLHRCCSSALLSYFFCIEKNLLKSQNSKIKEVTEGYRRLPKAILSVKRDSHQKISMANVTELLVKSFLVYYSPMSETWKVPKRPVEVLCDITQHLVAYRTAVETNSSEMRTHTGEHSQLACIHTLIIA